MHQVNIIVLNSCRFQVMLALVNTTNHVLASNYSRPCQTGNDTPMTTGMLLVLMKAMSRQITSSSTEIQHQERDSIWYTSSDILYGNTSEVDLKIKRRDTDDDASVHVKIQGSCASNSTAIASSNKRRGKRALLFGLRYIFSFSMTMTGC